MTAKVKKRSARGSRTAPALPEFDVERGIAECLGDGTVEQVGVNEAGEPLYRLTEAGKRYVEDKLLKKVKSR